jgi:hypothetical protein
MHAWPVRSYAPVTSPGVARLASPTRPILSPIWSAAKSVDVFGIEEYEIYIRMVEDT